MILVFFFFLVVLAVIWAEGFSNPSILPPRPPPHLLAYLITMIDAISGNAAPFVESCCLFHDLHLLPDLLEHFLYAGKFEVVIHQSRQPFTPYLSRMQIRHTLYVSNKRHVWNQWIDRTPALQNTLLNNIDPIITILINCNNFNSTCIGASCRKGIPVGFERGLG